MNINIVTVDSGWILQKIAQRIYEANPEVFSLSHQSSQDTDANFYIDVQNCFKGKTRTLDVGFFTHLHENSASHLYPYWLTLDHIVHMCSRYLDVFSQFYPPNKMSLMFPGELSKEFKLKKPTIGIFQRGEHEGKGFFFMKNLANSEILKNFKFLITGKGWEGVVDLYRKNNIEVEYRTDESYDKYPELYSRIDYLLIPSLWEAGPMSVIEGLGCGIPIISSDVGWVNGDLEVDYSFEPNNTLELTSILNTIFNKIKHRREQVGHLSYKTYGEKLIKTVENIK